MSRAAFFKDCKANPNMTLKLIGGDNYEWIKEKRPQNLNPRKIIKLQTNAVYLESEDNRGQGSYLKIPQASLMEYDGKNLSIYEVGIREMNEEEKRNEISAEEELKKYEQANPYSESFWHMKEWFKKCSTPWIDTAADWIKGKKRAGGSNYNKIYDKSIKGNLILQYQIDAL